LPRTGGAPIAHCVQVSAEALAVSMKLVCRRSVEPPRREGTACAITNTTASHAVADSANKDHCCFTGGAYAYAKSAIDINPAGGPLATPPVVNPNNAENRGEPVAFLEAGKYLVICNIRPHLLDGMYAYVNVSE
jgi:hypothetical protein